MLNNFSMERANDPLLGWHKQLGGPNEHKVNRVLFWQCTESTAWSDHMTTSEQAHWLECEKGYVIPEDTRETPLLHYTLLQA